MAKEKLLIRCVANGWVVTDNCGSELVATTIQQVSEIIAYSIHPNFVNMNQFEKKVFEFEIHNDGNEKS